MQHPPGARACPCVWRAAHSCGARRLPRFARVRVRVPHRTLPPTSASRVPPCWAIVHAPAAPQ
eukprot:2072428-Alexandrium_andersonii.AAC.1